MTINNTELYNKALEAIDNFQPIICRLNSGYEIIMSASWNSNDGDYFVFLSTANISYNIHPTSTEDNLYNPKNISISAHYNSIN